MGMRAALGVLLVAALAACEPVGLTGPGQPAVRLMGDVVVAAPDGYCVDPVVTRPQTGFALLAACAAMDPEGDGSFPGSVALITVQVGAADSAAVAGQEDAFRAFLETPQGAALLSASAIGGPVAVRGTQANSNAVAVYTQDAGPPGVAGTQGESWRLFTDVKGRLVTVSVRGLDRMPLSQQGSLDLVLQMLGLLRGANGGTATAT